MYLGAEAHERAEEHDAARKAHHVEDEDVAAPGGDHVDVHERGEEGKGPRRRGAHGAHPEVEGAADGRHGNPLVVIAAGHRAHEVRGRDAHEEGRSQRGGRREGRLVRHPGYEQGADRPEPRGHEDAHVVERHGHAERLQRIVDVRRGELQARVDRGADWAAERVPRLDVVPVPEGVGAVVDKVLENCVGAASAAVPTFTSSIGRYFDQGCDQAAAGAWRGGAGRARGRERGESAVPVSQGAGRAQAGWARASAVSGRHAPSPTCS